MLNCVIINESGGGVSNDITEAGADNTPASQSGGFYNEPQLKGSNCSGVFQTDRFKGSDSAVGERLINVCGMLLNQCHHSAITQKPSEVFSSSFFARQISVRSGAFSDLRIGHQVASFLHGKKNHFQLNLCHHESSLHQTI